MDGFLRFDLVVGMPAGIDNKMVMDDLRKAVESVTGIIRKRRKVTVDITGISPGRLEFTIRYWIDTFTSKNTAEHIRSEVILKIQDVTENAERYKI